MHAGRSYADFETLRHIQMDIPSSHFIDECEVEEEAGLEIKHLASLVLIGQLNSR